MLKLLKEALQGGMEADKTLTTRLKETEDEFETTVSSELKETRDKSCGTVAPVGVLIEYG